jgi:Uma2 family endonuclease
MTASPSATGSALTLPDHTQLPESDGTFVKIFQEHPQSLLLTDSIQPVLDQHHSDGQYAIGQDSGIYWRLTDPPERGAEAPDWFYVPNVPPTLDGKMRRSYVLWQEYVAPLIVLEFVSGSGAEERDCTPPSQGQVGKFWVYEQAIRVPYYGIYEVEKAQVEVYHLVDTVYQRMTPNDRGHYPIAPLSVELGIWQGRYQNVELPWLRWWDAEGTLLLTGDERAELEQQEVMRERQRTEQERQRADLERQKRQQLTEKLRSLTPDQLNALGIDPTLLD